MQSFPITQPAKNTPFKDRLRDAGIEPLAARELETLQVNVGCRCNLACTHCHIEAGPGRSECMTEETAAQLLRALAEDPIRTLDITGGAPELNPNFRSLVTDAKKLGKHVIVRTNLAVLLMPGMDDLPEFYRDHCVELIASLPCYLEENVNRIRGGGTFSKCLSVLRRLNSLGYGEIESKPLHLVYNPAGPFLPPPQAALERDYKRELHSRYGIGFNNLYTFTNMPVGRFRKQLSLSGELERYTDMLACSFNPRTLERLMCRHLISVGWDGQLYDCDFNQALRLPLSTPGHAHISRYDHAVLSSRAIAVDDHCYACTAGQGST